MSKTATQNTKPSNVNKADELRQLKLKKMEENNVKISKQLDRSADTWKNSMEQIRKIAKKTQDSSQILDNVFTENENEKSELESELPKGHPRSEIGDFTYYRSMPTFNSPFRPLSQHANYTSTFFPTNFPNRVSEWNYRMMNEYPPNNNNNIDWTSQNIPNLHNFNQSNSFNYPQPPIAPKFVYTNNRPINPWMNGLNQSNSALSNSSFLNPMNFQPNFGRPLTSLFPPNGYGNPYPNSPSFYPQTPIYNPLISNPYRPTFPLPKEDINGIESMKKYVNSLLDKLEVLNETVAKLKNPHHNNSGLKGCSYGNSGNPDYIPNHSFRHQSNCCSCPIHVPKIPRSCSCWDLPQHNHRRPPSSLSENYAYASTYNNCHHTVNGTPYSGNNYHLNCKTNDCRLHMPSKNNRERFIMHERQHFREYSHHQPLSSNYHNYMPYQNKVSNQHLNHFSHIKPPTPSYSLENHDPSSVALVIDNSNNNNITNVVDVDSSDKSCHDLLSLTELPDTSSM